MDAVVGRLALLGEGVRAAGVLEAIGSQLLPPTRLSAVWGREHTTTSYTVYTVYPVCPICRCFFRLSSPYVSILFRIFP